MCLSLFLSYSNERLINEMKKKITRNEQFSAAVIRRTVNSAQKFGAITHSLCVVLSHNILQIFRV